MPPHDAVRDPAPPDPTASAPPLAPPAAGTGTLDDRLLTPTDPHETRYPGAVVFNR